MAVTHNFLNIWKTHSFCSVCCAWALMAPHVGASSLLLGCLRHPVGHFGASLLLLGAPRGTLLSDLNASALLFGVPRTSCWDFLRLLE